MWGYEEAWVEFILTNNPAPQECIDYYTEHYDLPNLLPYEEDGTPLGIKAILWNRLDHWSFYPADAELSRNGILKTTSRTPKHIGNY